MKKRTFSVLKTILCVVLCFACSNDNKETVEQLKAQVDSLQMANEQQANSMNDMMLFVNTLADGLDSIAQQERVLFYTNKGPEGVYVDRAQLKRNLEMFENMLANQRERIASLADSLKQKGERLDKLNTLIAYLNAQLDEKNELIATLRSDLENKNLSIAQLQRRVKMLSDDNSHLSETVESQKEALTMQSDMINECYVKIGTKKQLTDLGIISGGFLKKTKVAVDNFDKSQFMRVDIREFTEIPINSPEIKILTQMPASSYRIERNGSTSTLYVVDPTQFWSVSNYLVILTK